MLVRRKKEKKFSSVFVRLCLPLSVRVSSRKQRMGTRQQLSSECEAQGTQLMSQLKPRHNHQMALTCAPLPPPCKKTKGRCKRPHAQLTPTSTKSDPSKEVRVELHLWSLSNRRKDGDQVIRPDSGHQHHLNSSIHHWR